MIKSLSGRDEFRLQTISLKSPLKTGLGQEVVSTQSEPIMRLCKHSFESWISTGLHSFHTIFAMQLPFIQLKPITLTFSASECL